MRYLARVKGDEERAETSTFSRLENARAAARSGRPTLCSAYQQMSGERLSDMVKTHAWCCCQQGKRVAGLGGQSGILGKSSQDPAWQGIGITGTAVKTSIDKHKKHI
jgi:hypothetical protein